MFDNPRNRFILRVVVVAAIAGLSAASAVFVDNVALQIVSATVSAAAVYAGVGASVPQVEPHIGNKMEGE